MMRRWISSWNFRYPRTLVYMLQATEYDVGAYLAWHRRISDFRQVERRGRLVRTHKALLLLVGAWLMAFGLAGLALFMLQSGTLPQLRTVVALLILIFLPDTLARTLVPLLALAARAIQMPIEWVIVRRASHRLRRIPAIRIGIAGSFGKTTMREILKTVLSEGKRTAAPPGSHNTPLGISRFIRKLRGDEEVLVFELGEYYPGDVRRLCHMVRPDIGVITGVNEAHLEKFRSLDRATRTIFELADELGEKPVYVNGESERAAAAARSGHIVYSRAGAGGWHIISDARTGLDGTSFVLSRGDTRINAHSNLLGLHHIGALAVAATIASDIGLSPSQIENGIAKTKPFAHRLEPKIGGDGIVTLDDSYNGNPDGAKAVIAFLADIAGHRRWYITPGLVEMGTRTEAVHREIGHLLARAGIEKIVLIRNSVTSFIAEGLREEGYVGDTPWFDDMPAALAALPHLTVRGDVVLIQNDWPDQYQ